MRKTVQETIDWLKQHYKLAEDIYFFAMTKDDVLFYEETAVSDERFVAMCEYVEKNYGLDGDLMTACREALEATDTFDPADQNCEPDTIRENDAEYRIAGENYGARDE
jgi:hypothetical protein